MPPSMARPKLGVERFEISRVGAEMAVAVRRATAVAVVVKKNMAAG